MDRRLLARLDQAIEELGRRRYLSGDPVRRAKDDVLDALVAYQSQPLATRIRELAAYLRDRVDDIETDEPTRAWEALLYAWQALELEARRG